MTLRTLEVCADSIESVAAAAQGGATRVELCSGLSEGGVTPSVGFVKAALAQGIKVNVLIRPRGGDFIYTPEEADCMITDIKTFVKEGVNGVVIGALTPDGNIDMELCRRLVDAAEGIEITFHRAFDLCRNPMEALEDIISLGCHRLLTSGQATSAEKGVKLLAQLHHQSAGRITIMAGSGVNETNARMIATESGVSELHASARHKIGSKMTFRNENVSMGAKGSDEYSRMVTSAEIVKKIISEINSYV